MNASLLGLAGSRKQLVYLVASQRLVIHTNILPVPDTCRFVIFPGPVFEGSSDMKCLLLQILGLDELPERIARAANQAARFQTGGTIFPRFDAMTNITIPVVVHRSSASTDDSTPKLPPVKKSGPLMVDLTKPCEASFPETIPEKMADCV